MSRAKKFELGFAPEVIAHNSEAVAVLLAPADDDDLEGLLLARSPRFQSLLARSSKSIKQGKGLSQEDFWKAVAERTQDKTEAVQDT